MNVHLFAIGKRLLTHRHAHLHPSRNGDHPPTFCEWAACMASGHYAGPLHPQRSIQVTSLLAQAYELDSRRRLSPEKFPKRGRVFHDYGVGSISVQYAALSLPHTEHKYLVRPVASVYRERLAWHHIV